LRFDLACFYLVRSATAEERAAPVRFGDAYTFPDRLTGGRLDEEYGCSSLAITDGYGGSDPVADT
jgi:hypothetical protein